MPECDFNKVATSAWVHAAFFRTPFPKNTSGGLLLKYCRNNKKRLKIS